MNERAPPKNILILGGGTAGWMAANLFAHAWGGRGSKITLLESAAIGIIGVGEGSTPKMRRFFDRIGVSEAEWMPACNASYKCGIRFPDWSTRKGFKSYYHPFFSLSDDESIRAFHHNLTLRQRNLDVHAHPDAFFISNHLAENRRAPIPTPGMDYDSEYAYHFDAGLIGKFLKDKAINAGVEHIIDTVTAVNQGESGDIASVETEAHGAQAADFFIDCTGFASILICKTLGVNFKSYTDILFNDRAVAMPTPLDGDTLPSETVSTALKYGWVWKIPLTNRFGNGYVYSSSYIDEAQAEQELRQHLGLEDDPVEARHLKMRVGRLEHPWEKNCLAVGLSQGFIEPLEATALMIVQDTLENFIDSYENGGYSDLNRPQFNRKVNAIFDAVKDYIFMHYKLNSREDTDYWVDNRENENVSDSIAEILRVWDKGGDLLQELRRQAGNLAYSPTSWFCILTGMGRLPRKPKKPSKKFRVHDPKDMRRLCTDMIENFPDHRAALDSLAD
ncbi:MAG: tryptophan halogenase family protein [Pseudomonadota bacterium]